MDSPGTIVQGEQWGYVYDFYGTLHYPGWLVYLKPQFPEDVGYIYFVEAMQKVKGRENFTHHNKFRKKGYK